MDGWARAARFIVAARSRRYRTQEDFATHAGVSVRLIGDLETGQRGNYTEAKLNAVEAALGWEPGSIRIVAHGGRPKPERDADLIRLEHIWRSLPGEARRMLLELAERAARE